MFSPALLSTVLEFLTLCLAHFDPHNSLAKDSLNRRDMQDHTGNTGWDASSESLLAPLSSRKGLFQ